jgi:hypothetical protein
MTQEQLLELVGFNNELLILLSAKVYELLDEDNANIFEKDVQKLLDKIESISL